MTKAQRKVKRLIETMDRLRDEYNAACIEAFPVGTEVAYAHGKHLRMGHVVDTGYGHRLKVQSNENANAAPWIDTYRIIQELE